MSAMRGWEGVTRSDLGVRSLPKPSKYKNVKVQVENIVFDSKREANYWLGLKARAQAGEIHSLERQVVFALCAPDRTNVEDQHSRIVVVANYVCDFSYYDREGTRHIVDSKGKRTAMYLLKRKWLELQDGIVIEEV